MESFSGPGIMPRRNDVAGSQHVRTLREAVQARMAAKHISLADALAEISAEGTFRQAIANGERLCREKEQQRSAAIGQGRGLFTRFVEAKKTELLSRNPRLSELDAFRQASEFVARNNPASLRLYRQDSRLITERTDR
jgi:hypothetical protein